VALFIVRRLLQAIVVLLLVTAISFALLRAIPGNVAAAVMGPNVYRDPAAIKLFDDTYGFNRPWYSQYLLWLGHLLQGKLGYSWNLNQTVASLLGQRILKSGILVGSAVVLAVLIAIPVGMVQAVRRNKFVDHFFNGASTVFYAMPSFLLGLLLILVFAIKFPIFPAEAPQGVTAGAIFANFNAMILPIATLTLITVALYSRYMRSSVLDNLTEDYVRTAKAKGITERRILFRHVLRNSLIPIATLLGLSLPGVLSGALITESVFNYPGMGLLFLEQAEKQDYPTLLGIIVVVAVAVIVGSLLADIAYAVLDPRVRYSR
jgi:peptide/nickel transport system permease protein